MYMYPQMALECPGTQCFYLGIDRHRSYSNGTWDEHETGIVQSLLESAVHFVDTQISRHCTHREISYWEGRG